MKNGHGMLMHGPLKAVSVFYLTGVGSRSFVDRVKSILGSWPSEEKASNQEMPINFESLLLLMVIILGAKRAI